MLNFHNLHSNMIMKAFSHEDTNNDYKKNEADHYNHETERLAEDNKEPDIVRSFPRISLLSLLFIECIIIVLHPIIIPMRRPPSSPLPTLPIVTKCPGGRAMAA